MAEVDSLDIVNDEALYYTKEGRSLIGSQAPTAFAWSYPWPPCATNLSKNKVFRPQEEQKKELVKEVQEEFKKQAKPLGFEIEGTPLNRTMVSEIELAIYWDRNPYEFHSPSNLNRAKSAANLSSLGELIQMDHVDNHTGNRRSGSADSRNKRSRSSSGSITARKTASRKNSASENVNNQLNTSHGQSNGNHAAKSTSPTESMKSKGSEKSHSNQSISVSNPRIPKILQVLTQNEKRKFEEIKSKQSNNNDNNPKVVRDTRTNPPNSIGVQVTLDDVTTAALKSTYLCPLHGKYRQGVDRRSKSGFRTDMSSNLNPHARCSRSRTKLVKNTECQTGNGSENLETSDSNDFKIKKYRSKTAGANQKRNSSANNMLSEYNGNYRHPAHIANSENRRLRNKILSYCFTKHSIF